jgi:hypothetical protein
MTKTLIPKIAVFAAMGLLFLQHNIDKYKREGADLP